MLNYRYQFLKYVRNYGYYLKKSVELWAPCLKNVAKCLLFIEKSSLPRGIMSMVFIILWNYGSHFFKDGRNYGSRF